VAKYLLTKKDLLIWLKKLQQEYEVLAPVKEKKVYNFGHWDGKSLPDKSYQNTLKPPKDLFFPQHEILLKYKKVKGQRPIIKAADLPEEKRVIFGIRPCDAKSLSLLDKVFLGEEYQDPFYQARRLNTLIISLVCREPKESCFCTQPFSVEGSDIVLFELNDKYLVEPISEKGKNCFPSASYCEADFHIIDKIKEIKINTYEEIASADLTEKLDLIFDSPIWKELQEKCINCGVCSFLCPTCHCFDITDNQQGSKVRNWDSCMFSGFTKQASGHNPRPSGTERLRQRVMHKFKYFPDKYGVVACVGCGRCVEKCPVNLDIRQVLLQIKNGGEKLECRM